MLMGGGQLLLFGMNFVFLAILTDAKGHTPHPRIAILLMAGLCFVSFVISIFVKEDLRRLNAQKLEAEKASPTLHTILNTAESSLYTKLSSPENTQRQD
jgi:hypothetical protein